MDDVVYPIAICGVRRGSGDVGECFFKACAEDFYFFGERFGFCGQAIGESGGTLA